MNEENIQKLIQKVRANKQNLPYININEHGNYAGWVTNFHMYEKKTQLPFCLDLTQDNDLFLLFALASCWSKTGQWQNSALFCMYLKMSEKDDVTYWSNPQNVISEKAKKSKSLQNVCKQYDFTPANRKVSFRSDFYDSLRVLSDEWQGIKQSLEKSEAYNDYQIFIEHISQICGLGAGKNTMKIKIPLILRELRIQGIYKNIPGKWCCVPDQRVKKSASDPCFSISLPSSTTKVRDVLRSSEIIYNIFGDLYDLPLFSYPDLKNYW